MIEPTSRAMVSEVVRIPAGSVELEGNLEIPEGATGLVIFAHGSGSSRRSPRNQWVARVIRQGGIGTLLFDLLTRDEEMEDADTGHLRFDIEWLAGRLIAVSRWLAQQARTKELVLGYFGASTGAAAALVAAATLGSEVRAVVSRGGRPDLAMKILLRVQAPTLLIVGEKDEQVLDLNEQAYARLRCPKELTIVPNATHLFEEPGTLEKAADLATRWFQMHLKTKGTQALV